ncbi:lipopolysaccharide biosynthesis protein [Mycoplasmatota bacterium WC30]
MIDNQIKIDKSIIKGSSWQFASIVINSIVSITLIAVLARLVIPEAFGVITMANSVIIFAQLLSEMGVEQYIIRKKEINDKILSSVLLASIIISVLTYFLLFFAAPVISNWYNEESLTLIVRVVALTLIISRFGKIPRAFLQREMKFKSVVIIDLISYIIGYAVVGIVLAFFGFGVWAIVIARISQTIIQSALLLIFHSVKFKFILSLSELKSIFKFGFRLVVLQTINNFANQVDYILIGRFSSSLNLAYYERSFKIMTIPVSYIGTVFDKVLYAYFSKVQSNEHMIIATFESILRVIFAIAIPIQLLIYMLNSEIILIILGEKWLNTAPILASLSIGIVFRSSIGVMDALVRLRGEMNKSSVVKLIYVVLLIVIVALGLQYKDVYFVALYVNIAVFINFILMILLSSRINNHNHFKVLKSLVNIMLMNIIPFMVLNMLLPHLSFNGLWLFINPVVVFLLYFIILLVLVLIFPKSISGDYHTLINTLKNLMKRGVNSVKE